MSLILSGSDGLSDVDGSASTPAIRGTDANTGIFFPAADTIAFAEGGTEVMRIDSSGNVGIGTTSPDTKFQISGTSGSVQFRAGTDTNGYFEVNAFDSNPVYCIVGGTNATAGVFGTQSNTPTIFFANNTERARITSGGDFLVGTTTTGGGLFKVQAATDVCLGVASATGVTGAITLNAINNANSANIPFDIRASAIYASVGIGTTASAANAYFNNAASNQFLRSTSALKYKTNIRDLESIDVNKFRPVRYNSLCEADDPNKEHFGIIADEVAANGIEELITRNADGEIEGFQYERLTVVLLKAIQELKSELDAAKARIAVLEAK